MIILWRPLFTATKKATVLQISHNAELVAKSYGDSG